MRKVLHLKNLYVHFLCSLLIFVQHRRLFECRKISCCWDEIASEGKKLVGREREGLGQLNVSGKLQGNNFTIREITSELRLNLMRKLA